MDREQIEAEDFAAEAEADAIALELERRAVESVPELYEPSPYDGTYSEM